MKVGDRVWINFGGKSDSSYQRPRGTICNVVSEEPKFGIILDGEAQEPLARHWVLERQLEPLNTLDLLVEKIL